MTQDAASQAFRRLAEVSSGRGGIYRLLAEAFRDPTIRTVNELVAGTTAASVDRSLEWLGADRAVFDEPLSKIGAFAENAQGIEADQCLLELKIEYARIFIGPPRAEVHPYASMHISASPNAERLLNVGGTARTVEQMYQDAGLQLIPRLDEPPDHVATEFEFLYYLCTKEQTAWEEADNEKAREWRRRQREFIDEHLKEWCPTFLEEVEHVANDGFYEAIASLGRVLIAMEAGAFKPGL